MKKKGALLGIGAVAIVAIVAAGAGSLSGHASGEDIGCDVEKLPRRGGAGGVRATCEWPVPASRVQSLLNQWGRHHRYFSSLADSEIVDNQGGVVTVRQVHRARGMSDREVVVNWSRSSIAQGMRYKWNKATDQSALSGDNVEVAVHDGKWEVTESGEGARVVYESYYLPGGSIPGFLVRWFQSDGVIDVLEQFREVAEAG